MAACGNHDILPTINRVSHWRSIRGLWCLRLPQNFAGIDIECTKAIVGGGADKDQAPCGDDRTAVVFRAGGGNAAFGQFGVFAEDHLPFDFPNVQVDGMPWRARMAEGKERPATGDILEITDADGMVLILEPNPQA